MNTELQFWLYFFLLNSFFFLPRYLMEARTSTFIPYKGLLRGPWAERVRFLINRYNYDLFRVSADFFLLAMLILLLGDHLSVGLLTGLVFGYYLLILTYQIYYHFFENIYQLEPIFFSDSFMLRTGFQIFIKGYNWLNFLISLGVLVFIGLLFFLISRLVQTGLAFDPGLFSMLLIGLFGLLSLYSLVTYNYKAFGKIVFPSQTQSLLRNAMRSHEVGKQLAGFDFDRLSEHQPYGQIRLNAPPNIYFLVLESYGRIVYDHPELHEHYLTTAGKVEGILRSNGWDSTTHLSEAPIAGGGSWISYTSLLFGLNVKDQGTYLTLMNRPVMHRYQHLMRWLKGQGYRNYRLVPIAGFQGMKIPWESYSSFYAIDEWIKANDINFTGRMYGFGPCPPDQYALNFAGERITQNKDPFFLFFITQNSHSPFTSPTEVAADWRSLNDQSGETPMTTSLFAQPRLPDYRQAIDYQLEFITDYIAKKGTEKDLFVLIGDHQPPVFPGPQDGLETPVHIISKNSALIRHFRDYGFREGMVADISGQPIHHAGFYSMLVRALARAYGVPGSALPEYLPEGLKMLS